MNTKTCSMCKKEKNTSEFFKCKKYPDGLQYRCKECSKKSMKQIYERHPNYSKEYYQKNKEQMKNNMVNRYRIKKTTEPWHISYCAARQRAKEKNIEFNIDVDYIKSIWTDVCPILNIPLKSAIFESGLSRKECKARPMDNSPTIDRIDPSKGYIKGNVCIISYRANMIKNCGTLEEHEKIVNFFKTIKLKEF